MRSSVFDVAVQVADLDAELGVVVGELLGHALGERRDEHALARRRRARGSRRAGRRPGPPAGRTSTFGSVRPGRPDDLLDHHAARLLELAVAGRRRDVDALRRARLPLLEAQRPVVERRRQPEAELDERLLARAVAAEHPADLRHADVALVDHHQQVLREVVEERVGRLAGGAAVEPARVVLDAVAEAHLLEHLEVVERALLEPLRLEQLALPAELGEPLLQLAADALDRARAASARSRRSGWPGRASRASGAQITLPRSGSISAIASISSPKNSMRSARSSSYCGNTSTTSPRTRNVPRWKSTSLRS